MNNDQAAQRQAALTNDIAELLRELQMAHTIIGNASQLMSPLQRMVWAERNARSEIKGNAPSRDSERAAVLSKATGSAA